MIVRNAHHNHESTFRDFYFILRKEIMTNEMKQIIIDQSRIHATSTTILNALRCKDDSFDSIFKNRNMYNFRATIKKQAFRLFTSVQNLMKLLRNKKK